eukprot:COSAG03_NODE_1050_length_4948_cov_15.772530_3_plen_139_part_00
MPGGSFLALLLAATVGHKALAARSTPSPVVLMLFLLLELGYVVASTFTLVSISMSPEEQQALTDDIPKVWSRPPPFIVTKHLRAKLHGCIIAVSYDVLPAQVTGVGLSVAGLFLSMAAMAPAYSLRAACMPNANLKRR